MGYHRESQGWGKSSVSLVDRDSDLSLVCPAGCGWTGLHKRTMTPAGTLVLGRVALPVLHLKPDNSVFPPYVSGPSQASVSPLELRTRVVIK